MKVEIKRTRLDLLGIDLVSGRSSYSQTLLDHLSKSPNATAAAITEEEVALLVRPAEGQWVDVYKVTDSADIQRIRHSAEAALNRGPDGLWLFAYLDLEGVLPKNSIIYNTIRKTLNPGE